MRVRIPAHAKFAAKKALKRRSALPSSKKFGLSKAEASKQRISSGVERAKQIIRSKTVSQADAKKIAAFYNRFKGCKTTKCEGALGLWGGRKWGRQLASKF